MSPSHGSIAKAVRRQKEKHPELFCPQDRCLWRTGGGRCPRHGGAVKRYPTIYRLVVHAAHYGDATKRGGGGHDLDEWDVTAPVRMSAAEFGLLAGAEWHHGYVDAAGAQHWVFTRLAKFSNTKCDRCAK